MIWKAIVIAFTYTLFIQLSVDTNRHDINMSDTTQNFSSELTLFLSGDVMTGRGIDQILPHSVNPKIYESYVKDARDYVTLAEKENGPIDEPVSYQYIWGKALDVWEQFQPDFKLINLETSITTNKNPWPLKGINYRMHPGNVKLLTNAGVDYCALANNHTIDWKEEGLEETVQTLEEAGIAYSGAGMNKQEARKPAILHYKDQRIIVLSYGIETSGIPESWEAKKESAGINFLDGLNNKSFERIREHINSIKQPGDIITFSIHWGGNWGYDIPKKQKDFARKLIDKAGVDIIHGHSSHHPKGIEVYKEKLIIYGAGDFINDYEGISGHEEFRDDLTLMYFPTINLSNGDLVSMKMVPMKIKNFRLNNTSSQETEWLQSMLKREGKKLGTGASLNADGSLSLEW